MVGPDAAAAAGADTRGSKRARLANDKKNSSERNGPQNGLPFHAGNINNGEQSGFRMGAFNGSIGGDGGGGGGGGAYGGFMWSNGKSASSATATVGADETQEDEEEEEEEEEGGEQEEGGGMDYCSAEMGGGDSAAHPNAMVVATGGGEQQQQQRGGAPLSVGGRVWPTLGTNGLSGRRQFWGKELTGAAGGGAAVISSGFGSGGFPQHRWHQDQGGSNDDMLILYGSPT